ncbi:MAG: carboxymuconolactone decarboxylase family protein [Alphaproteobacteria bacterium]
MSTKLPKAAGKISEMHPKIWEYYNALAEECGTEGPLSEREIRLVKLALAAGIGSEGAVHSHSRRALAEGLSPEDLRHVGLLAIPTMGFPKAMAALTWIEDLLDH